MLPINLPDLLEAAEAAPATESPGLDGLSYEFYTLVFDVIGPATVYEI